jgi:DNA-binding transcriptional regulator YiaG
MDENPGSSAASSTPPTADPALLPDQKPDIAAIAGARSEAQSLLAVIKDQGDAATAKGNEIEQVRLHAERAKGEIDAQVEAMKGAIAAFNQHVEAAKTTITELTSLAQSLQTTSTQAKDTSTQATALLESLRALATTATDSASRIEAIKTEAIQTQEVIKTKNEHIEGGRKHVDDVRKELDAALNEARQAANSAEAQHQASRTTAQNLTDLYTAAQTTKANTDSTAEAVKQLRQQCEEHAATAKNLADIAQTTEQKVKAYEARLAELDQAATDRLKTIENLLPGAASAGLASAFNQRRAYFKWPQRIWQGVFVASVLGLLAIAGVHAGPQGLEFGLLPKADATLTWDHLGLSLLYRLPFAVPLIWLAFHSSHKAALAQRVEEDYGFKETVSRSFEGFRREMAELEGKVQPHSPLGRLCTGVLGVVTDPPGRIYEKHPLNKTPLNALAESAAPIAEVAAKVKPPIAGE